MNLFPQHLSDNLQAQCEPNQATEEAMNRLEVLRNTPKDELVNRLANKLVENEIVADKSEHSVFEN